MKRMAILSAIFVAVVGMGFQASAGDFAEKAALYVPNRIVTFFDIFSFDLGWGPSIKADVQATKACDFAAGIGSTAKVIKGVNRQYGFGLEKGYKLAFGTFYKEDAAVSDSIGSVQEYWYQANDNGAPNYKEKIYDIETGARDYWAVGVGAACFVEVDFAINPIDLANFVTGFFFYDLKDNQYTFAGSGN